MSSGHVDETQGVKIEFESRPLITAIHCEIPTRDAIGVAYSRIGSECLARSVAGDRAASELHMTLKFPATGREMNDIGGMFGAYVAWVDTVHVYGPGAASTVIEYRPRITDHPTVTTHGCCTPVQVAAV